MKKQAKQQLAEELCRFFMAKYGVSRYEVEQAIRQFGHVKEILNTYFLVQAHEKNKRKVG